MFGLTPEQSIVVQVFTAAVVILLIGERLLPDRHHQRGPRAFDNVALQVINISLIVLLPISLIGVSLYALFNQLGVFNQATTLGVRLGLWGKIAISLLVMDLFMYWLHRGYHRFPLMWKFHRVHHGDLALDLTTTFRTHPIETLMTFGTKAGLVLILGVPLLGVVLVEIVTAVWALFIHSNLRLGRTADRVIRLVLVTPSHHRLHHDRDPVYRNSNFGLILTIWDRLFGTLGARSRFDETRESRQIGLTDNTKSERLGGILVAPFRSP